MSKISTYDEIPQPTLDDYLIGTDVSDSDNTKNFKIEDIVALSNPYKVYTSLLTDNSGTIDSIVLQNNLGTITWEKISDSWVKATSDGLFIAGKTFLLIQGSTNTTDGALFVVRISDNELMVVIPAATFLDDTSFEVRVYN